jgi:hypothetical protein
MAINRERVRRRVAVLDRSQYFLQGLLDGIEIRILEYDSSQRALVVEYQDGLAEGNNRDRFHDRLLSIATACGSALEAHHWPTEFDQLIGVACDPTNCGLDDVEGIRWQVSTDWLGVLVSDEVPDEVLLLSTLNPFAVRYSDGRIKHIDPMVFVAD